MSTKSNVSAAPPRPSTIRWFRSVAATAACVAAVWGSAPSSSAAPQIGVAGLTGDPAGGGRNWALVHLRFMGGAEPHPSYRIYWKQGPADSPSAYILLGAMAPTADVPTLTELLNRAGLAGVDLVEFESRLDELLGALGAVGSLPDKLAFLVEAESESGLIEAQRESLAASHPVVAAALGRAFFDTVPDDTPSTFEVRAYDPAGGVEGPVVGRATVPAAPEVLPSPDGLAERIEESARGHLRVGLMWCFPDPLRKRFLHWGGFKVFRAERQAWRDEFGADPPVALDRALLLAALDAGHITQVNRLPVHPAEHPTCPLPPVFDTALFVDDKDSADGLRLVTGDDPFEPGDQYMFWVAAADLFDRIGDPSPGHLVTICDRLAPNPPTGLSVTHRHRFSAGTALTFGRLEWDRAPASEVRRWYLYRTTDHDDAAAAMDADPDNPITPDLLAIVDNDGAGPRVVFDHDDGAVQPIPNPGETVYYHLRAEDQSPCLDGAGRGNLSGPSGPVPFALHNLEPPGLLNPRPGIMCCEITVGYAASAGDVDRPFTAILRAKRPLANIRWVEFREVIGNRFVGRFEYPETATPSLPGGNEIVFEDTKGGSGPVRYAARFGAVGGIVSDWVEGAPDPLPYGTHSFTPRWQCVPLVLPGNCPGFHPPLHPETGAPNPFCIAFNAGTAFSSYIVYRRVGPTGPLVKVGSGLMEPNEDVVFCDIDFPPGGGELCYFLQGFGVNGGSPGPMEPAGCITTTPIDGLPRPAVVATAPAMLDDPGASPGAHDIEWFCPRMPERFQLALSPAPAGAESTVLEFLPNGAIRSWGLFDTTRTATPFGADAPRYRERLELIQGVGYRLKVRATRGVGEHRDEGPWSEIHELQWMTSEPQGPEVPWPMRDVPGITGTLVADWDETESIGRVVIGRVPQTAFGPQTPLPGDIPEAFLDIEPPFTAYLHESSATGRGTMLQVTHQVREILYETLAAGILIHDLSIQIAPEPAIFGDLFPRVWLRIDQPLIAGRSYIVTLVKHRADGEIEQVLQSNPIAVPAAP